jgi:TorA maturation chaperone TorD
MSVKEGVSTQLVIADIFRLLANCFDFPTAERLQAIREISDGLCSVVLNDDEIQSMIATLHEAIDEQELLNAYSAIFIKGGLSLSESHTLRRFDSVSNVSAYYRAFGFSPKSGENPDSIMYELEYLALLLVKTAIAPNAEAKKVSAKAYKDFLTNHVGEFGIALAQRIREGNPGTFFLTVSYLLEAVICKELAREQAEI